MCATVRVMASVYACDACCHRFVSFHIDNCYSKMLRARQALDDARDAEGTFGWLASRLLRQRISDIPDQDYEEWQYLSKMQLQGKGNEEELRNQVVRVLAGGAVRSPTGHRMFIKGEHQIEDIAIANGVSFYDTPFMARVGFLLRKAEELRCSTPPVSRVAELVLTARLGQAPLPITLHKRPGQENARRERHQAL